MADVFISYRRNPEGDGDVTVGRLADRLRGALGGSKVYRDKEGNVGAPNWRVTIEKQIRACEIVLAWIDQRWLDSVARLGSEDDVLAWELALATSLGKRVIPLLVGGVKMPATNDLPPSLRALTVPQGIEILGRDGPVFDDAVRRIIEQIAPKRRSRAIVAALVALVVVGAIGIRLVKPSAARTEGDLSGAFQSIDSKLRAYVDVARDLQIAFVNRGPQGFVTAAVHPMLSKAINAYSKVREDLTFNRQRYVLEFKRHSPRAPQLAVGLDEILTKIQTLHDSQILSLNGLTRKMDDLADRDGEAVAGARVVESAEILKSAALIDKTIREIARDLARWEEQVIAAL